MNVLSEVGNDSEILYVGGRGGQTAFLRGVLMRSYGLQVNQNFF